MEKSRNFQILYAGRTNLSKQTFRNWGFPNRVNTIPLGSSEFTKQWTWMHHSEVRNYRQTESSLRVKHFAKNVEMPYLLIDWTFSEKNYWFNAKVPYYVYNNDNSELYLLAPVVERNWHPQCPRIWVERLAGVVGSPFASWLLCLYSHFLCFRRKHHHCPLHPGWWYRLQFYFCRGCRYWNFELRCPSPSSFSGQLSCRRGTPRPLHKRTCETPGGKYRILLWPFC